MYSSTHTAPEPTVRLAPADETPTGQSRLAYRLAGAFAMVGGALALVSGPGPMVVGAVVDIALGAGLLGLRRWARQLTVVRAALAAVLLPFLAVGQAEGSFAVAAVVAVFGWMYVAAQLLLLTGRSAAWRIVTAGALFSLYALVALLGLLVLLLQ